MKAMILLFVLILSYELLASDLADKTESCFPENNLEIPVMQAGPKGKIPGAKSIHTGLTLDELKMTIGIFEKVWNPILSKKYGKVLKFKNEWESGKVDTFTTRDDENNPLIVIRGGLVRHPDMTVEGMMLILCHELGHHYGGAPKNFRGRSTRRSWSSAEGQADYFAANKCMPRILNETFVYKVSKDLGMVDKACDNEVCKKIVPAAMSVGKVFATLRADWKPPVISERSNVKVYSTYYKHPMPQCRFDTFVAGSLCTSEYEQDFDDNDHRIGSCLGEMTPQAARPRCWFSPEDY